MKTELTGWWFSTADKKLGYNDNRPVAVGLTHTVTGPPVLCGRGLHLSVKPLDALIYAPGSVIWRVKISGNIIIGDDKSVGTTRTYLAGGIDISDELRAFARAEALAVAHLWNAPEVVIAFLRTGDESLRDAAREAARAAVVAARAAAVAAARAAVAKAGAVAGEAAWAAEAARAVREAWAAVGAAELARQNKILEEIFNQACAGGNQP